MIMDRLPDMVEKNTIMKLLKVWFVLSVFSLSLLSPVQASTSINEMVELLVDDLLVTTSGTVMQVGETGILYIRFNRQGSVREGTILQLVLQDTSISIDDRAEEDLGTVKIFKTLDDRALAHVIDTSASEPRVGDSVYSVHPGSKRVLAMPFDHQQDMYPVALTLRDKLVAELSRRGVPVIEPDRVDQELQEQRLSHADVFDTGLDQEMAGRLGAEIVIQGVLAEHNDMIRVESRMVDLVTGNTLGKAEAKLPKASWNQLELAQDAIPHDVEVDPIIDDTTVPKEVLTFLFQESRFASPVLLGSPNLVERSRVEAEIKRQQNFITNPPGGIFRNMPPLPMAGGIYGYDKLAFFLEQQGYIEIINVQRSIGFNQYAVAEDKLHRHLMPAQHDFPGSEYLQPEYYLMVAKRRLENISFTNSFEESIPGRGRVTIYAVVFSYKLEKLIAEFPDVNKLFTGKAQIFRDPTDGEWKIIDLELSDRGGLEYRDLIYGTR